MANYDALRDYLNGRNAPQVRMSLGAIDELITGGLPEVAYEDAEWWTDQGVWAEAGYQVGKVELVRRMITFTIEPPSRDSGLELAEDGLPTDDDLRKTCELAGIGPIDARHVERFVGGDAEAHLGTLLKAGLLHRNGHRYTRTG